MERFFINLVLVRVLYTHALVAAPRLALGWLAPAGRLLGDPRLGITGIFLSLSRVLPDRYPLGEHVTTFVEAEHGFGHLAPAAAFGDAQGFAVADAGGHRDPVEDLHDEPRRLEVDDEVRV
ncbi:hypothetical protein MXEN_04598 [Mycobacterium xenopi RIVM700367]|uniref:hypothetical protein n=1 Tax=Mycobacterium xenopi TaxID=1789 RepID=UPI00025AD889|nr:hypothetical protein [Mycobacterium xenopi]EID16370.1 hypothetical protein MXEN_04598 [Mycobacterium xenopi RIVM700367]